LREKSATHKLNVGKNKMKRILQMMAVLVLLAAGATWLATGSNSGWTKTSVVVKTLDPVTGIEGITYREKFLPGVDFPAGSALAAGALGATSLFFRKKNLPTQNQKQN
jgi:hypothetical protein